MTEMVSEELNPMCGCGCGREVSRPTHRYIQGHASPRKLSGEAVRVAKDALSRDVSQYAIARVLGVSQATICAISFGMLDRRIDEGRRWVSPTARKEVLRASEIAERANLNRARRSLNSIRRHLKGLAKNERLARKSNQPNAPRN